MTTSKNLLAQIEETLARNNAHVSANLISIAQIFAQLDERFAAIETKLERLLPPPPAENSTRAQQLIALLDERIKAALEREQRALCEATSDVVRSVLSEFVYEIDAKLKQLQALLAERPPVDPRPN